MAEELPNPENVEVGDFYVIPYMPMFQEKGIVVTKITQVWRGSKLKDDGFEYQNLPMGVHGEFYYDDPENEESLIGRHIKKADKDILPTLSNHECYLKSLEGLKNLLHTINGSELEDILDS